MMRFADGTTRKPVYANSASTDTVSLPGTFARITRKTTINMLSTSVASTPTRARVDRTRRKRSAKRMWALYRKSKMGVGGLVISATTTPTAAPTIAAPPAAAGVGTSRRPTTARSGASKRATRPANSPSTG